MLLSQTDPAALGRMLTYYGYFGRARAAQIDQIREHQQQLQALGGQIEDQSANSRRSQDDGQRALADLSRARAERAQSLAAISREVKSRDQELADLKRQEQAIEALLADLARVLQDFPTDKSRNFNELRGRLPWPVAGRIVARSHDPENGVLIDAAKGAAVRAPYFGRVVYADWLQGLGLLLIIGHDGGYMSLYGHAEVLYKSVGDSVAPGDVIASLDDAEGKPAQLYFEIRQGRKPLDPRHVAEARSVNRILCRIGHIATARANYSRRAARTAERVLVCARFLLDRSSPLSHVRGGECMAASSITWRSYGALLERLFPRILHSMIAGGDGANLWASAPEASAQLQQTMAISRVPAPTGKARLMGCWICTARRRSTMGSASAGHLGEVLGFVLIATKPDAAGPGGT